MQVLASAEGVVIGWLLSLAAVTNVTSSVGTRFGTGQTFPAVRVTRVGGTVDDPWHDNPRVQIEFWGSSPQDTQEISDDAIDLLARTVVASVDSLYGSIGGGFTSSAYVSLGPLPSSDPVTNRYRQLIEITLEVE